MAANQARALSRMRVSSRHKRQMHRVWQASHAAERRTCIMKRTLFKLGLLLLLGTIINVAVAIALALSNPTFGEFQRDGETLWNDYVGGEPQYRDYTLLPFRAMGYEYLFLSVGHDEGPGQPYIVEGSHAIVRA